MASVPTATAPVKVTPASLLVTVTVPVPLPMLPMVAAPPASRIVSPPETSAIDARDIVAPAVVPVSRVSERPFAVTAPTARSAFAPAPVSSVVASSSEIAPRFMAVLVVAIVPPTDTMPVLPVVWRPPMKVSTSPAPPSVRFPSFRKDVAAVTVTALPVRLTE